MSAPHAARGCIVVGIDGSGHADTALTWAAAQAHLERRPLLIVHSAHLRDRRMLDALIGGHDELSRAVDATATDLVETGAHLATTLQPGLDVRTMVVEDDPREALIAASREARLVVVGVRGLSRWRTALLGSVSSAVALQARCPVVVTSRPVDDAHRGVLVGADGTASTLPVMEFAFGQASLHQWPLTVLHCFWDIAGEIAYGRMVRPDESGVEDLRMLLSESVAGLSERFPDVQVDLTLARGLVDVVLAERLAPYDLVVVGRHHPSVTSRLLNTTVTQAVLEHARGTVAVVPEASPRSGDES